MQLKVRGNTINCSFIKYRFLNRSVRCLKTPESHGRIEDQHVLNFVTKEVRYDFSSHFDADRDRWAGYPPHLEAWLLSPTVALGD